MGGHGTPIVLSTLDGASPALSVAVSGAECSDLVVFDRDIPGVVASSVVKLVFGAVETFPSFQCLATHSAR